MSRNTKILIINGPNLNLLGQREPEVYGTDTMEAILAQMPSGAAVTYFQSNHEGALIDRLQAAAYGSDEERADGVVLNAGGYSHTSVALRDAVAAIAPVPVVEVHITNIYAREDFRHTSLLSAVCRGTITGLGLQGYKLAVEAILEILENQ